MASYETGVHTIQLVGLLLIWSRFVTRVAEMTDGPPDGAYGRKPTDKMAARKAPRLNERNTCVSSGK